MEAAYQQGLQEAIAKDLRRSGIRGVTTRGLQQAIRDKGAARWGPGVRLGQSKYQTNFAPFRDVIERTALPPRRARGDPANIERVTAIAVALHNAKVGA